MQTASPQGPAESRLWKLPRLDVSKAHLLILKRWTEGPWPAGVLSRDGGWWILQHSFCLAKASRNPLFLFILKKKKNPSFKILFFFPCERQPWTSPAGLAPAGRHLCSLAALQSQHLLEGSCYPRLVPGFLHLVRWPPTSGDPVFTAVAQGTPPSSPGSGGGVSSWGPGGCNNQISSYLWHTSTRPQSHPQRHRQQIETCPLFLVKDAYFLAQELWPEGQAHFKGHSREAKAWRHFCILSPPYPSSSVS